jgi:hypothetical protein
MPVRRFTGPFALAILVLSLSACAGSTAPAGGVANDASPMRAAITRAGAAEATAVAYHVRAHIELHGPGLPQSLDATVSFRPGHGHDITFDNLPPYAAKFSRLFYDFDSPARWSREDAMRNDGYATVEGHRAVVLRMTKRAHSTTLDRSVAYVDATTGRLLAMAWFYAGGGTIVATQTYGKNGLPAIQHATFDLAGMHATATVAYGTYVFDSAGSR